ncbi:3-ketoacyl-CoA synthase 11-like [Bidens hawaiensis]|uniref:3-ketoacyl-CoA synthase 11-like n=1 Tax=Bidens hawaiensis TaxID=980011 RepID=UPI00404ACE74
MFIINLRDLPEFLTHPVLNSNTIVMMYLALLMGIFLLLCFVTNKKPSCKVYLIDFVCYKPPDSQKSSKEFVLKQATLHGYMTEETLDFMKNVLERCGIGDSAYLAETFFKPTYEPLMKDSRREIETTIFSSVDMLLRKTGVTTDNIGILIVNCCIYSPEPSLSSIIVNRYKLNKNIITYNLVGMGCSAGLLAVGLAKQLLQVHQNSYALVVSTESITENCYVGKDPPKFLINCLFRVGGAAILLSNRPSDHNTSKYQLLDTVHVNTSSSNRSYNSIIREEDNEGLPGVNINRDLLATAISTIKPNLITVGRLILPIKEKLYYQINYFIRKVMTSRNIHIQQYIPNYSNSVDHFLPHVGGKPVLDDLQKTLRLSDVVMEASRMTLYRFGNTSSSSTWYELAYVEAKGRVKRGDMVWQLAFGSGFKCSSVIWRAMKSVDYGCDDDNPWTGEIDQFPVQVVCGAFPVDFAPSG